MYIRISRCALAFTWLALAPLVAAAQVVRGDAAVRDSAGAQIVQLNRSLATSTTLQVAARPRLVIGGATGDPDLELFARNPLLTARTLSDGRVVVGDQHVIRFYSSTGTLLRSLGRRGRGPGEFVQIRNVCVVRGDTILVTDQALRRLTVVSPSGQYLATHPLTTPVEFDACFSDGSVMTRTAPSQTPPAGVPSERGDMFTDFHRITRTGEQIASFGRLPFEALGEFRTVVSAVVRMDSLYFADSGSPEVQVYNGQGALVRIVRWQPGRVPAAPARAARANRRRGVMANGEEVRTLDRKGSDLQRYLPEFASLIVDAHGRLWLEDYPVSGKPRGWTVLSGDGQSLQRVVLPTLLGNTSAVLLGVGADHLIVRVNDEQGFRQILILDLL